LRLSLAPTRRFEAIDVNSHIVAEVGDVLRRHRKALYCSLHTTAGYLEQSLSARLRHNHDRLSQFFGSFHALFPEGAAYHHDRMELRTELSRRRNRSSAQRRLTSHLHGRRPQKLRHVSDAPRCAGLFHRSRRHARRQRRRRTTAVVAYDRERVVAATSVVIPMSKHPIESVNLADPRLGMLAEINDLLAKSGLERCRVDLAIEAGERHVGLTVNEYETLLMKNDLVSVLKDPLRFAKIKARHMLDDPLAIPARR